MKSRWEIILLTPPLNSSVYNTSKVNRSECFIITLQCRCFLSSSSLLSRNLRSLIILFLSTSDKWKFQVYNFMAFRQIILYGVVVSQKNIFENKMIHVVYWIDKSYILIPSWYERWAKKHPISKKNCIHGTRWQRITISILFQMNHANIHMTWLSDLFRTKSQVG